MADHTMIAPVKDGPSGRVVAWTIVSHPGRPTPTDPTELRHLYGITDPTSVIPLHESPIKPLDDEEKAAARAKTGAPGTDGQELAGLKDRVAELEAQLGVGTGAPKAK